MQPEAVRKTVQFSGELTDADMEEFVRFEVIPTVVPFSADTSEIIFGSGIDNHLIFVAPAANLSLSEAPFKAFHTVAQKMRPDRSFVFVTVDADSNDAEPVMQFFELEGANLPTLIGFEMEPGQRKYPCALPRNDLGQVIIHSHALRSHAPPVTQIGECKNHWLHGYTWGGSVVCMPHRTAYQYLCSLRWYQVPVSGRR